MRFPAASAADAVPDSDPDSDSERATPSRRASRVVAGIVVALSVLLAGCAGGEETAVADPAEVDALREEVAALTERDIAHEQRLEDLETATARLDRTDPSERVTEAEREVARLLDMLTAIEEELAAAVTDHEQRDTEVAGTTEELAGQNAALLEANEQLRGSVAELRDQLDTARGRIDRVSGEIEDLEVRYETLRDRLDRAAR